MPHTPSSDSATTRKPETAPPRIATWTASTRLRRAAAAVRRFERTLMYMPMIPDAMEQAAPTRHACLRSRPRDLGERAAPLPCGTGTFQAAAECSNLALIGPAIRREGHHTGASLYCAACEPTPLRVPLRSRRDARSHPRHLPRHP